MPCPTCTDEETFHDWRTARIAFDERAKQKHAVVTERSDAPVEGSIQRAVGKLTASDGAEPDRETETEECTADDG